MARQDHAIKPLTWIYISGIVFVSFIGLGFLIGLFGDRLARLQSSTYFFLLIPIALMAAAFLFGALRSHAKYSGKVYGGTIELGGPVVLLALIIFLGYKFRPESPGMFDVTINVYNQNRSLLESGRIKVSYASAFQVRPLNEGQAILQDIPGQYRGKPLRIIPQIEGYSNKEIATTIPEAGNVVDVVLEKIPDSTQVRGTVTNSNGTVKNATVVFAEGMAKTSTDSYGNFRVMLPLRDGSETSVQVFVNEELKYNTQVTVSSQSPVAIKIPEP